MNQSYTLYLCYMKGQELEWTNMNEKCSNISYELVVGFLNFSNFWGLANSTFVV